MTSGPPRREALSLQGPAGRLEALLDVPSVGAGRAVGVVCHPHPQHQGTMLNKVVHTLGRAMLELGAPVLRFNFRGVGASEGTWGDGIGETDDLIAAAGWVREHYPGAALWLAGFSFGAAVAIRAAAVLQPRHLVSVAPPVTRMAGLLGTTRPAGDWLVVQGKSDEVVSASDVEAWARALNPPPQLVLLPDVDHFFHGRLTLLRDTVVGHLGSGDAH